MVATETAKQVIWLQDILNEIFGRPNEKEVDASIINMQLL